MKYLKFQLIGALLISTASCAISNIHMSENELSDAFSGHSLHTKRWGWVYFSPDGRVLLDDKSKVKYQDGQYEISGNNIGINWPLEKKYNRAGINVYYQLYMISEGKYLECREEDISKCNKSDEWVLTHGDQREQ